MSMEKHLATKEHKVGTRAANTAKVASVLSIMLSRDGAGHAGAGVPQDRAGRRGQNWQKDGLENLKELRDN